MNAVQGDWFAPGPVEAAVKGLREAIDRFVELMFQLALTLLPMGLELRSDAAAHVSSAWRLLRSGLGRTNEGMHDGHRTLAR